jgi:hypothetical protein
MILGCEHVRNLILRSDNEIWIFLVRQQKG